jgi:hypothetical protein
MVYEFEKVGRSIGKQGKLTNRVELEGGMTDKYEEVKSDAKNVAQNGKAKVDEFKKEAKHSLG